MAKVKSTYGELCKAIEDTIKASAKEGKDPAVIASNGDLLKMTQSLINCPEHEVEVYEKNVKNADGKPVTTTKKPAAAYRESLKKVVGAMGVDKNELDKLDDIDFSKDHAKSLMEVASTVIHDYTRAGRKFNFDITEADEAQMSLSMPRIEQKITMPNRFDKDENGKSITVPTGKTVTTAAHRSMKAGNKVPFWLKEEK